MHYQAFPLFVFVPTFTGRTRLYGHFCVSVSANVPAGSGDRLGGGGEGGHGCRKCVPVGG